MSGLGVDLGHAFNDNLTKKIGEILSYLQSQGCPEQIHAGVILGSGLGKYTEALRITHTIPYSEIPSFPQSTVEGHSGALILVSSKIARSWSFQDVFIFMRVTRLTKR